MPKKAEELGALAVGRLKKPGVYAVDGVAGLMLQVEASGGRSWILRAMIGSKRRDMGLGGFPDVSLAEARRAAGEAREKIRKGIDPIEESKTARAMLKRAQANAITFKDAAKAYIETHEAGWSSAKHGRQWSNSLATHVEPHVGDMLVRDIELSHILSILEPIWRTKTETASRVRGRVESILDWSTTKGYRDGLNPARWKGHLDHLLPARNKVKKVRHYPAVQLDEAAAFTEQLRLVPGASALALQVLLLTAVRSFNVRAMTRREVDFDDAIWDIPGEAIEGEGVEGDPSGDADDQQPQQRMKAGRAHRVPLSAEVVALLREIPDFEDGSPDQLAFRAPRGGMLSDMALSMTMRRLKFKDKNGRIAVPHGLRSTFRDWASERTHYPSEVAEMALAHIVSDKVEAAYRRGDLFEKRRQMMADWAGFLATVLPKRGEVVELHKGRPRASNGG
ncbi:MAG: integrase arm-type DNA-binding domain-containing protein [Pseudomonadota bacterium]|nr:integrase arm-type DNA-binding domain-containing protein [Pseudomonadota bacterium]